jgi:hypothetical protein
MWTVVCRQQSLLEMSMAVERRTWAFGVIYMALSIAVEVLLIAVAGLKVPDDNAILAPVLLAVSPVLAALIAGYRRPAECLLVMLLTIALTVFFVVVFGRVTGISTGLLAPILIRSLAGLLAALITSRMLPKTKLMEKE